MRLFVAINLPDVERQRLYAETALLRGARLPVRWVAAPSLHLTLKFLGEVTEPAAPRIADALALVTAVHAPFTLTLQGVGAFPNLRRPRVVWLGSEPAPELLRVQGDVEASLAEMGFERETRPYSPHLTLGRAENDARASDFAALDALAARIGFRATVEINTVDLMLSRLRRSGAEYERIAAAQLAGRSRTERPSSEP